MRNSTSTPSRRLQALIALLLGACLHETLATDLQVPSQYPTISNAVKAAKSGDTIRIAKGDYYEQFLIVGRTNLTLQGEPGAILHATMEMEQTLLPYNGRAYTIAGVVRESNVTFRGLEFDGHRMGDNYEPNAVIAVVFRGSSGRIENCNLHGFRGHDTLQHRAVNVENTPSDSSRRSNIEILNNTFSDNRLSVVLRGDDANPGTLRTVFKVEGNNFSGLEATIVSGVGLVIAVGAGGEVKGNRFTGHLHNGSEFSGIAVAAEDTSPDRDFYRLQPVTYSGNIFSNNNIHISALAANGSTITNNVFDATTPGAVYEWAVGLSGTNIVVADNNFAGAPQGVVLLDNFLFYDTYASGRALNTRLTNNWFTNVTVPIRTNEHAFTATGTKACCFQPMFLSITNRVVDQSVAFQVRAWHERPTVLEASSDLRQWMPVITKSFPLPISEFEESAPDRPKQFYQLHVLP